MTKTITRKVDDPKNPGKKLVRKYHATFPTVGTPSEEGKTDVVEGSVSVDALLATFGSLERIAKLCNDGVVAKVRTIAFNELGKGDEVSKNIAKALNALKQLPGMDALGEDTLKAMLMQSPQIQTALSGVNIEAEVSETISIDRIFTDMRGADEDETEEAETVTA